MRIVQSLLPITYYYIDLSARDVTINILPAKQHLYLVKICIRFIRLTDLEIYEIYTRQPISYYNQHIIVTI